MKTQPKKQSRSGASQPDKLARVDSTRLLGLLFAELKAKRAYWQNKTDDPHQIANAVYATLAEVESAVRKALWKSRKP